MVLSLSYKRLMIVAKGRQNGKVNGALELEPGPRAGPDIAFKMMIYWATGEQMGNR